MYLHPTNLDSINGQLLAWNYVNRKVNYGIDFYLRDMSRVAYGSKELPFDSGCIRHAFECQLLVLVPSGTPGKVNDLELEYIESDWAEISAALKAWLFLYINGHGQRLSDSGENFEASDEKFRDSVADAMTNQIKEATAAKEILHVPNSSTYFQGFVFLLDAGSAFYELRLGNHF